jgi:hypothetical protein
MPSCLYVFSKKAGHPAVFGSLKNNFNRIIYPKIFSNPFFSYADESHTPASA